MDQDKYKNDDNAAAGNLLQQFGMQVAPESDGDVTVLKILNGLHRGAEVRLHAGTYTIGSSDECDFVLKDPGIESEHLALICKNKTYTVLKKDGDIHIEGKRIQENEVELDSRTILKIGSVSIGLVSSEDGWEPNLSSDKVDGNTDETQKGIVEQNSGVKKAASEAEIEEERFIDSSSMPLEDPADLSKFKRFRLYAVAAGVILVMFIFACGYKTFIGREAAPVEPDTTMEKIAALFQESNLSAPQISYRPGSVPKVTAYTLTKEEQEGIVQKIQALPFDVKYAIYSSEKIVSTCRHIIKRMDWKVDVEYIDQGSLLLKGFVTEQENADAIVDQLKREVSGIHKLDQKLWFVDNTESELSDILSLYRLRGKISWQFMNGYILASGTLDDWQWQVWQAVKEHLHSQYGPEFTIKEQVKTARQVEYLPGKINLPLKSVTLGKQPYLTMINGQRYFMGGPIKGGMFIKDITANRIVIDIDGRDYHYEIAHGKEMQKEMTSEVAKRIIPNAATEGLSLAPLKKSAYDEHIAEAANRYEIAPDLIRAVIQVESAFNPRAVSHKGAMGLMQIMPQNFEDLNISNPFDPGQNIMGGSRYLKELLIQFDQKLSLALAAYNAGPGAVQKYNGIPRYKETQAYVKKVMQLYRQSQAPAPVMDEDEKDNLQLVDRPYMGSAKQKQKDDPPDKSKMIDSTAPAAPSRPALAPVKVCAFDKHVTEAAKRYDIAPDLIRAVIQVESAFNPRAVSHKGAMGLMQIMPQNYKALNISNPFDPRQNIMGGSQYLKELLNQFDQQLPLALAAYNAGPGAVLRYKGIPRYKETQNYVKKVMRLYRKSKTLASVSDNEALSRRHAKSLESLNSAGPNDTVSTWQLFFGKIRKTVAGDTAKPNRKSISKFYSDYMNGTLTIY